jgi:hypothetical protein
MKLSILKPRGGDLIFFGGADASDLVEIVTHVLPNGIAVVSRSNLTHVDMVVDPGLLVNGKPQTCLNLIESTIMNGKSGPQINPADARVEGYEGLVFLARLKAQTRAMLDWDALWKYLLGRVGPDHYSIKSITDYLVRLVPFIGSIPYFHKPEKNAEVCSEYLAAGFRAGGFPAIDSHETSPQKLAEWGIYSELVQLAGPLATIRNFNTV